MNRAQKHACFNLVVVGSTLGVVTLLYLFARDGALGGFGLLGLLGLGGFFYYNKRGAVISDERDESIGRRCALIAYTIFWVAFVATGVSIPMYYGDKGSIPVFVVEAAVWLGFMLFISSHALATLVLYRRGI